MSGDRDHFPVDDRRVGLAIRMLRRRRGWRQVDLGARARLSQTMVSLVERGHLDEVTVRALRQITAVLEASANVDLRWRGGAVDRLLDERHAEIVNKCIAILVSLGWTTAVEVSFSKFGERGSIDVLAWHPATETLLVIEVKSEITSVEETVRRFNVKTRLATQIGAESHGWRARRVAAILVLPEGTAARNVLRRFGPIFDAAFPARSLEIRAWLRNPVDALRGVWLLSLSNTAIGKYGARRHTRVRVPRERAKPTP